jgi:acetoin utilization deacetylase AcuC-like enzyme
MDNQLIYHRNYDIYFYENIKKIADNLQGFGYRFSSPQNQISKKKLRSIHSAKYLRELSSSNKISEICKMWIFRFIPNCILQKYLLEPMCWQAAGTILAVEVALKKGWAINLGGGFYTAKCRDGNKWNFFNDIHLAVNFLFRKKIVQKVLIINSNHYVDNELINNSDYNIDYISLHFDTKSESIHLYKIKNHIENYVNKDIDIVLYISGTDTNKNVSVIRNILVMEYYIRKKIPIVMLNGFSDVDVYLRSIRNICERQI